MIPQSFTFFGITVYIYGLLIGLGILVSWSLIDLRLKEVQKQSSQFSSYVFLIIVCGIIGARLWHVLTDWQLYEHDMRLILAVWNGGLSIVGGLAGGVIGAWISVHRYRSLSMYEVLDALVMGLPVGQAVGRLGNWVNQELYGYPTDLPWRIFIKTEYRSPGFETVEYFHPLFAYEMVLLLVIAGLLWLLRRNPFFKLGTGNNLWLYLAVYGLGRSMLEFLRIEKTVFGQTDIGVNQVIMGGVGVLALVVLLFQTMKQNHAA